MINKEEIESILSGQKFSEFRWINTESIIVAHWVRVKCTFGCNDYGLGTCPPNTPSVQDCKRFFNEYKSGVIIRLTKFTDKNNYASEWSNDMTNKLLETEKQLFLKGYHKTFLLNQTCCGICNDCTGNRIDCKDKKHSRPSPEAFAVDVYQTVRNVGMEINVIAKNPSEINRYAFILIE
jgi:predicted metal-binding protein